MMPLVRLPLRLDSPTYVSGEQILKACEQLAREREYFLEKKLEKYYEEGQYHSLRLKGAKAGVESIEILISTGDDINSVESELNLKGEDYNTWHIYVENDRHKIFSKNVPSDKDVIAAVKEVRDRLGEILARG